MKHFNLLLSAVIVVLALQIFNARAELEIEDESVTIETLFHVISTNLHTEQEAVALKSLLPGSFKRKLPEIDRESALEVVSQMIENQKDVNIKVNSKNSQMRKEAVEKIMESEENA